MFVNRGSVDGQFWFQGQSAPTGADETLCGGYSCICEVEGSETAIIPYRDDKINGKEMTGR